MDLLGQFIVRVVFSKDLGNLLVCKLVMCFVSLLEVEVVLEFCFLHASFHLLAPSQRLLEFLRHASPHLLLSPYLLLRHLYQRIEVHLHTLHEGELLLMALVEFLDAVAVDEGVRGRFEFALEVSQLFAVVDGHAGEAFIQISQERVGKFFLELRVLE